MFLKMNLYINPTDSVSSSKRVPDEEASRYIRPKKRLWKTMSGGVIVELVMMEINNTEPSVTPPKKVSK